MANLLDYLNWRGDLTLEQSPFNEVDNLILAELSFVDFKDIIPAPGEGKEDRHGCSGAIRYPGDAEKNGRCPPFPGYEAELLCGPLGRGQRGAVRGTGYRDRRRIDVPVLPGHR